MLSSSLDPNEEAIARIEMGLLCLLPPLIRKLVQDAVEARQPGTHTELIRGSCEKEGDKER
ncbi:hypothetical protein SLEP1_g727 [Rubroshorea leprosula]|uniref:Uncharacterized protein n=1 Tax=Rubroshorea leprosula TaxID=152421 RepID=A0AAV5HHB6_9ROSI|nr:hypothetical protein SLEP1_g727 [Rubroshorea leprosula]